MTIDEEFSSTPTLTHVDVGATSRINLPAFSANHSATWFKQAEIQFLLHRTTKDKDKVLYVLASLPTEVMIALPQELTDIDDLKPYEEVKKAILNKYGMSELQKVEQLLSNQDMGDLSPSEFYAHLGRLAGGNLSDDWLTKLWKRCIPQEIVMAITPIESKCQLEEILSTTDKIWDLLPQLRRSASDISSVSRTKRASPQQRDEIGKLKQQVARLARQVNRLSRSRDRSKAQRGQQRSRSGARKLRWAHKKFGDAARKCQRSCPKFEQHRKKHPTASTSASTSKSAPKN